MKHLTVKEAKGSQGTGCFSPFPPQPPLLMINLSNYGPQKEKCNKYVNETNLLQEKDCLQSGEQAYLMK